MFQLHMGNIDKHNLFFDLFFFPLADVSMDRV